MENEFTIRKAELVDVPEVYAMAYELAKYQNLLHRFCVTEKSLQMMIEDPKEATTTIVAVDDKKVLAFAMFTLLKNNRLYHDGFAMYIDELYVNPAHRNNGIGKKLFKYIANQAIENRCNRLEWWVTEGNDKAVTFYKKIGGRALTEFSTYRLQQPELSLFAK